MFGIIFCDEQGKFILEIHAMKSILLLIVFLIIGVLALIIFGACLSHKKGKKVILFMLVTILSSVLCWILWVTEIFPGSECFRTRQYFKNLTGIPFYPKESTTYKTKRSFHGDGYSINVYEYKKDTYQKLQDLDTINYPILPDNRSHWKQQKWQTTPIKENETIFLDFATDEAIYNDLIENKKLQEIFNEIKVALSNEGSFYAYNFNMPGTTLKDIDLYIIIPLKNKIIIINHNT